VQSNKEENKMLAMLNRTGLLGAIIGLMLGVSILGFYNVGSDFTADEMTEFVQGIENVDKGAIEILIDGLGEGTKGIYRFFVDIVNANTDVGDVGDGVDLLVGTFDDMTGSHFGSTFEGFVDGFIREMKSVLQSQF